MNLPCILDRIANVSQEFFLVLRTHFFQRNNVSWVTTQVYKNTMLWIRCTQFEVSTILCSIYHTSLLLNLDFRKGMPWNRRRQWHPTPVLLPGKSHGWRSLVGCSPWGRWGSDTTERLHFHFSLSRTGEGNGNPLQCSCLENPRDGGAWWAAVYGVTQSQTLLKWLSSSSSSMLQNESW